MAENYFGLTNTGRVRDNNEDAFIAETLPNGWIAACVIDGVGGYEGGEVAADIARSTLLHKLQQLPANPLNSLREALLLANQNIYNEKLHNRGNDQMACVLTIALVDVESNQFYYAHVGDTRLYLLRDQSLVKVTKDHSFVGFLEDSGRLTEAEAMQHPKRNEINKALGFDPQIDRQSDYIETGSSPFLSGDMLLLCSDGLSDLVSRKEIVSILLSDNSLPEKAQDLIDAANTAGGKDNITVVMVRNPKKPVRLAATKPVLVKKSRQKEAVKAAAQPEAATSKPAATPAKSSNPLTGVLSVLCLLLAGACFYFWFTRKNIEAAAAPPAAYTPHESEKRLRDSLGLSRGTLTLLPSLYGSTILLGDTLFVRQDSLRINGNGLVLAADSAFAGPALYVKSSNSFLLLENVVLKDFATALLLQSRGVQLKNVQFLNCPVPVQQQIFLPADSVLNGTVKDTFLIYRNSLPKTNP